MRAYLIAVLCLFVLPANAQDYKTILDLPEGVSLVNLSASERVEIEQDLLVANLRFESDNDSPKALQDTINKTMKKALNTAKKVESVKVSTQQYRVYEYDKNRGKKGLAPQKIWRGQQGLMVKGKKADDLLELVADLQEIGLTMNNLSYQVSPELLETTREGLLEDALKKLTAKAERTAKALGKSKAELKQITVNMGGHYPRPVMARGMAMNMVADSAEVSAPVAAPGENNVTLNVSAQAFLK